MGLFSNLDYLTNNIIVNETLHIFRNKNIDNLWQNYIFYFKIIWTIRHWKTFPHISHPFLFFNILYGRRDCLHHAIALGLEDLQVLSDNQTLIRAINSKQPPKEIFGVVSDINRLAACFLSITFSFVYCSANVEADTLSKEALRFYPTGSLMG